MIFESYSQFVFFGLYSGKAGMIEVKVTEIVFGRLSLKGQIKALELGFSPALNINCNSPDCFGGKVADSETANCLWIRN